MTDSVLFANFFNETKLAVTTALITLIESAVFRMSQRLLRKCINAGYTKIKRFFSIPLCTLGSIFF